MHQPPPSRYPETKPFRQASLIPAGNFLLQFQSEQLRRRFDWRGVYANGQTVQISATPIAGFTFQNWTGGTVADENASSTSLTITQDLNLTANFSRLQPSAH